MKPKLHFTAPYHWINDPNGLIYYKGQYHVFYQHFPYENFWGTMHWGHATTKDFIHYEHHPIALYPSTHYDRNGIFSGSAIEVNDQLYLYYTAIRYAKENPNYVHVQYSDDDLIASQAMMISQDGFTFDHKHNKQLIIDVIHDSKLGDSRHTRDPKVWKMKNGKYALIIGSKFEVEHGYCGEVLLYESEDAIHFTYKNRFYDETIGDMWECPDLFELDNQYFLIFSPEHIRETQPDSQAMIMSVSFDEETMTITKQGDLMNLDYGLDFYAPQTFLDEQQKRTMLGWMRMRKAPENENWVGMFVLPRHLSYHDNHIYQSVHPHVLKYFDKTVDKIDFSQPFILHMSLKDNAQVNLGGLQLSIQDDCLHCDRNNVSIQHDKVSQVCQTPILNGRYDLTIYYDQNIFEIYINDGYYVLSQIVYGLQDDIHINNAEILEIRVNSGEN